MEFKELKKYNWNEFSKKILCEDEIINLLGNSLFRLTYNTYSYEFATQFSSITKIIFVKNGWVEIIYNGSRNLISKDSFILVPKGRYDVAYGDKTEILTAILVNDLPDSIVKAERERFPNFNIPWRNK